ncbi:hypothetical protein QBC39DRAFT_343927 [Podospora conica]|nr:hypothetical protein QBC39DRAFT_343927 [Schizothecium conicum]
MLPTQRPTSNTQHPTKDRRQTDQPPDISSPKGAYRYIMLETTTQKRRNPFVFPCCCQTGSHPRSNPRPDPSSPKREGISRTVMPVLPTSVQPVSVVLIQDILISDHRLRPDPNPLTLDRFSSSRSMHDRLAPEMARCIPHCVLGEHACLPPSGIRRSYYNFSKHWLMPFAAVFDRHKCKSVRRQGQPHPQRNPLRHGPASSTSPRQPLPRR